MRTEPRYQVKINALDPAVRQIAADLSSSGGLRDPDDELVYEFPTVRLRDRALRLIRGSFGRNSVARIDLETDTN